MENNKLYDMFNGNGSPAEREENKNSALRRWFARLPYSVIVIVLGATVTLIGASKLASGEGGAGYLIAAGMILMLGFAMRSSEKKKHREDEHK